MTRSRNAELVFDLSRSTTTLPGSSFTGSRLGNWKQGLVWTLRWTITTSAKSFRGTLIERNVVRKNSVDALMLLRLPRLYRQFSQTRPPDSNPQYFPVGLF